MKYWLKKLVLGPEANDFRSPYAEHFVLGVNSDEASDLKKYPEMLQNLRSLEVVRPIQ